MAFEEILRFWFGNEIDDAAVARRQADLWWGKNTEADDGIASRFGDLIAKACDGELTEWEATARGRLALILLADQFPRSIHRGSALAFSCDAKALIWCLDGLAAGVDHRLRPIERVFFYLPLEHSEHLEHQERSVRLFRRLLDDVRAGQEKPFEEFLDFAVRHREIIARFGRFPHRNKVLGRASTPEEVEFLQEPGSSF